MSTCGSAARPTGGGPRAPNGCSPALGSAISCRKRLRSAASTTASAAVGDDDGDAEAQQQPADVVAELGVGVQDRRRIPRATPRSCHSVRRNARTCRFGRCATDCASARDCSPTAAVRRACSATCSSDQRTSCSGAGTCRGTATRLPGRSASEAGPAVVREEGVVRGRRHGLAGGEAQPEDRLGAGREDVREVAADVAQRVVQAPHRHVAGAASVQLAERRLAAGVGAQHPRRGGQAAGLAQVADLRLLVGALLGPAVELAHRDDRDLELLGQQLQRARQLGDLLLAVLGLLVAAHQLQVVDDDELQVVALAQPAGLGPDLHHREVRGVVDVQRRLGDLAHAPRQAAPVVVGHRAGAHVVQRHARLGRQQAHGDLGLAHLEREDRRGQAVLDRRRARDVQPQRRVVGGDHGARREVQVVGVVDLDAAHRHGRAPASPR